jgi:hypothetical protein
MAWKDATAQAIALTDRFPQDQEAS